MKKQENMISFVYQFRNKLNAMFGDDKDFTIFEGRSEELGHW